MEIWTIKKVFSVSKLPPKQYSNVRDSLHCSASRSGIYKVQELLAKYLHSNTHCGIISAMRILVEISPPRQHSKIYRPHQSPAKALKFFLV